MVADPFKLAFLPLGRGQWRLFADHPLPFEFDRGKDGYPPHSDIDLKGKKKKQRKVMLTVGITLNLSVLFFYKYLFWVISELSAIPIFSGLHVREHALPLGISFFTFHAISYLVDVYKGKVGEHSASDFATYFFMFPHLVAGPIVRFESVRNDIHVRKRNYGLFAYGIFRFVLGLNKKILIANFVSPIADLAFASSQSYVPSLTSTEAWLGILAYTLQIYFDFSGYSDMAIGLAAMMGIHFDENFQRPYQSHSIREFWRRWHISLSSWLRDYLYIPLGGSRVKKWITYRNLVIVFALCGLWHGAAFTFLIWGLWHGALLILERGRIGMFIEKMPVWMQRIYCFLAVMTGWVFFRAENIDHAFSYFGIMFSFGNLPAHGTFTIGILNILALIAGLALVLFGRGFFIFGKDNYKHYPQWLFGINLLFAVISMSYLYTGSRNPFIYFNF